MDEYYQKKKYKTSLFLFYHQYSSVQSPMKVCHALVTAV